LRFLLDKYLVYLVRWQLSTPILWAIIALLGVGLWQTIVANLIGGLIFFWVDKWIFERKAKNETCVNNVNVTYNTDPATSSAGGYTPPSNFSGVRGYLP